MTPVGDGANVHYRDEHGIVDSRMLVAGAVAALEVDVPESYTLDADADQFFLAIEALRIRLRAPAQSPAGASQLGQRRTACRTRCRPSTTTCLRQHPQRFLLADDPGAGKTVMAGLFIKEAMARGWVQRCLVVVPGSLAEQWQDELQRKVRAPVSRCSTSRFVQGH